MRNKTQHLSSNAYMGLVKDKDWLEKGEEVKEGKGGCLTSIGLPEVGVSKDGEGPGN